MKLSIAMMVKNEEKNLERCLKSLQSIRDAIDSEIIIVDTGSDDNTVEIANRYADKVYFHTWNNDFSAMRNITINYASGKWIMIIDADEEIQNTQPLSDFLKSKDSEKYGAIAITCKNIVDEIGGFSIMASFRLFKNDGYFHYEGAVHNQPMFKGDDIALPAVFLLHYGYLSNDSELMERKFLRTSRILKNELEKNPDNIYYWTQLATTYGMHHDGEEAIRCIEKAYSLLPKKRTAEYIFVFTQMILIYQHAKNYEKVEQLCREALSIKEGYLDVYYYLAEAMAVKGKYSEAITNYEKYLEIVRTYDNAVERDISIMEYSLGNKQLVYYNLSNLYKQGQQYDKALYFAELLTDEGFIKDNIATVITLYLKLNNSDDLRRYFDGKIKKEWIDLFIEKLDVLKNEFSKEYQLSLARAFLDIDNEYGLLCQLVIDNENGGISLQRQEAIRNINLAELPVYCSDIFYYLLKWQYPLEKIVVNFKEIWISCVFDYINKRRDDLCEKIYGYLQNYTCGNSLNEYKLSKALCRYALLLDKLSDDEYKVVFARYIQDGISYMQEVYNQNVLVDTLVHEVKNDEEVFLLYMYKAQIQTESQSAEYVKCLRTALQAFSAMKRGIEMLLKKMQDRKSCEQNNEFEIYKQEIKNTIKQLIDKENMDEAKKILNEYKSIVPNDLESILLESRILLN